MFQFLTMLLSVPAHERQGVWFEGRGMISLSTMQFLSQCPSEAAHEWQGVGREGRGPVSVLPKALPSFPGLHHCPSGDSV